MTDKKIITKSIKQSIFFKASPHEIYEVLMDSKKHSELTGDEAHINRKVGGEFTAGNGYITGENIELIEGEKIVQWWHGSDWPKNHYSIVTFSLNKSNKGTTLEFTQSGVPEEHFEEISQGWYDYYWGPLKEMLGSS
jgi:activator of HSP90 ATPase